ncbi:hypothetical protein [Proteiniphilum sp.]|uniref:hypothetical protein n=1 Tax=Proteiniphilum sp. TaxID=1926877 RepID=UPI003332D22E
MMKLRHLRNTLLLGVLFLLTAVACKDEFLREDVAELEKQEENNGNEGSSDNDYIRVVADPEVALATANCIMAMPGETVSIPVAKAFAVWEQNQQLFGKKFSPGGDLGAVLIWAIPNELVDTELMEITDYEDINKAAIRLKTKPGAKGNAVIALTVNGEVRWSWHLWVTDYDPGADLQLSNLQTGSNSVAGGNVYRYKNNAGDNIFMDRNLGANSADKTKGKETHGMYYQWGKKDPLPGFAPKNYYPESPLEFPPQYRKNNLAYSIEFPDEYIDAFPSGDWYSYYDKVFDHDLWGGVSGKKTIYDPCPEGWMVPFWPSKITENGWSDLSYELSPWYIREPENQFLSIGSNVDIEFESPVLGFYPATGHMLGEEVSKYSVNTSLWTASPMISPDSPNKLLEESIFINVGLNNHLHARLEARPYAANVRCVRCLDESKNLK